MASDPKYYNCGPGRSVRSSKKHFAPILILDWINSDKLNAIKQYDEELRRSPAQMTVTIVNNDGWSSSNGDGTGDSTKSIAHVLKEKVTQLTVQNQFMKSKIEDLEFQLREATVRQCSNLTINIISAPRN